MKLNPKYMAEFLGTFTLVLLGCGAAVIAGKDVGMLGIAFAFGLALIGMAYAVGPISGCHINPAVTLGMWSSGRMEMKEALSYILSQLVGGIAGAWVLMMIAQGHLAGFDLATQGLGQNGYGPGYLGEYTPLSALLFELVATYLFVKVVLGSTSGKAAPGMAGLAIGLMLVVIHIVGINITGVSVNPARSLGPALMVGGHAMEQIWLFLLVPSVAGLLAGWCQKTCDSCTG